MKLLFDQNLSLRLVNLLAELFPESNHVFPLGLHEAEDSAVWQYAKNNGFILVTKDADFGDMSVLRGFPPKVVWIRRGNCRMAAIEKLLRDNFQAIEQLGNETRYGLLTLF